MVKITEYIIIEDKDVYIPGVGKKFIPSGSFVKPINPLWLPYHIKETVEYRFLDPRMETFAYTSVGIVMLPWYIIREVS